MPQETFLLMDSDSAWAKHDMIVNIISVSVSSVFIFSFSKITAIPSALRSRMYFRLSTVFLANLDKDFVRIMSIFRCLQSLIIFINSGRFFA